MKSVGAVTAFTLFSLGLLANPAASGAVQPPSESDREAATAACADLNAYGPVGKAEAVEDGVGDWLVWVEDRDGDLWICNASSAGAVYANSLIEGDLLRGKGAELLTGIEPASGVQPAEQAQQLCMAVTTMVEEVEVVATVADGMGDYLVWMKNADDKLWLCNASADSKLYALEEIGMPLGSGTGGNEADRRMRVAETNQGRAI